MSNQEEALARMQEIANRVGQHIRERAIVGNEYRALKSQAERTLDASRRAPLVDRLNELADRLDLLSASVQAEHYEFETAKTATLSEVMAYAIQMLVKPEKSGGQAE